MQIFNFDVPGDFFIKSKFLSMSEIALLVSLSLPYSFNVLDTPQLIVTEVIWVESLHLVIPNSSQKKPGMSAGWVVTGEGHFLLVASSACPRTAGHQIASWGSCRITLGRALSPCWSAESTQELLSGGCFLSAGYVHKQGGLD